MSKHRTSRRPSQGGTAPRTAAHQASGVAQFSMSEVAQFSVSLDKARNQVWIANLRYRDSMEDKVHRALAERLQAIHELFGQIPDTLEDVWVKVALNDEAEINELIDQTTATRNPFDKKYSKVEDTAWETCAPC